MILNIPYKTYTPTYTKQSTISGAGLGLFAKNNISKFDWIGFYPGVLCNKNEKNKFENIMYIMGCSDNIHIIEADSNIKCGVHMVNEAGKDNVANVWYVKFKDGNVLYFAGQQIKAGEELLTCYSSTYGKRHYKICNNCSDPRCKQFKHRNHSLMLDSWMVHLKKKCPRNLYKNLFDITNVQIVI